MKRRNYLLQDCRRRMKRYRSNKRFFKAVREHAEATPFSLPELKKAAKRLKK